MDERRAAEAEDELLIANLCHAPENVNLQDARYVAMGADVDTMLGAVHSELGALSAREIALGGTVDADVHASAALDADGVLPKKAD